MQLFKNIIIGVESKLITLDIFYDILTPQPVIIYAHGFNGFKDWGNFDLIANQFAQAGFTFIKFNFSHNGTTPDKPQEFVDPEAYGNNNYTIELDDLQTVIEWTLHTENEHKVAIDTNKIYLIGHSRGGGIVLIKATEEPRIKSIATWASVAECKTPWGNWQQQRMENWKATRVEYYTNSRTKQQLPLYYQLYQDYEQNKRRLNVLQSVQRLNIPLLICHGTGDDAVPVASAYALHAACKSSELFLVESDHVFGRKHPWNDKELPQPMKA
ncbi:MAG: alpha/beta hydrolase family protein, partial [Chitinophagaceae bacterium]